MDAWIGEKNSKKHLFPQVKKILQQLNNEEHHRFRLKKGERDQNDIGMRNLDDYHDLFVKTNTPLLADVFENFRSKSLEIY